MQRYFTLFFLFCGGFGLLAQEPLRLEDAVAEALQNNYDVQVQRYNAQRSNNDAHLGAAGLLPSLDLSGNGQYSNLTNRGPIPVPTPEGFGIADTTITGNEQINVGASAQLTYTLALANFRNYKVLQGNAELSQEQTQQTIETVTLQVVTAYYNLAKLANRLAIEREALARSREQLKTAQNRQAYGSTNRLAVLNAEVNVQTDSINLVSSRLSYENAMRDLNLVLGREIDQTYDLDTKVDLGNPLDLVTLRDGVMATNASLRVAGTNQQIAALNLSTTRAQRLPTLSVTGSYDYNYSENPISITPQSENWGPTVGASVNFNLFNGFQLNRNVQSAEINLASRRAQYKQAEQTVLRDLAKTYAEYQNNRQVLALNQTSLEAAQLNFERTQEAFDLGQATSVELRQAQLNLQQIENQLNDLRYDIKLNEVQLLQLSGQLVSQEELLLDR